DRRIVVVGQRQQAVDDGFAQRGREHAAVLQPRQIATAGRRQQLLLERAVQAQGLVVRFAQQYLVVVLAGANPVKRVVDFVRHEAGFAEIGADLVGVL